MCWETSDREKEKGNGAARDQIKKRVKGVDTATEASCEGLIGLMKGDKVEMSFDLDSTKPYP